MNNIKHNKAIDLYYECFGQATHPAVILIPGLGAQSISWADGFCQTIAQQGYYVIRVDNRDTGLSPHPYDDRPINLQDYFEKLAQGQAIQAPYTLLDMAGDISALLLRLSIAKAHIIGRSLGGMVAQLVAAHYPSQVLSLTTIMSSTGNPSLPQASPDIMALMMGPKANPQTDLARFIEQQLVFYKAIAGTKTPFDESYYRHYITASVQRSYHGSSVPRQILALVATGDLRKTSKNIMAKTLVIHGLDDVLIPKEASEDIAKTIPNATLQLVEGMGHEIPKSLWDEIIAMILKHMA